MIKLFTLNWIFSFGLIFRTNVATIFLFVLDYLRIQLYRFIFVWNNLKNVIIWWTRSGNVPTSLIYMKKSVDCYFWIHVNRHFSISWPTAWIALMFDKWKCVFLSFVWQSTCEWYLIKILRVVLNIGYN